MGPVGVADLGPRGAALWVSLGRVEGSPDGELALEACRSADRLDELNDVIQGRGVLELLRFRLRDHEGRVAEVKFDAALAEARQQQNGLRQMLVTLGVGAVAAAPASAPASPVDEFTARRRERKAT